MLTPDPGSDQAGGDAASFTDIRDIQATLKQLGVSLTSEAEENARGPASLTMIDPDGNPILIDKYR